MFTVLVLYEYEVPKVVVPEVDHTVLVVPEVNDREVDVEETIVELAVLVAVAGS